MPEPLTYIITVEPETTYAVKVKRSDGKLIAIERYTDEKEAEERKVHLQAVASEIATYDRYKETGRHSE